METTESKEISLEEMFEQLDTILEHMEDPELSLEHAFALYEQGMKKIQNCNQKLDTVEKKMLQIAEDGTEVPFE
ncbi:exodeoxyribonuclease VII small subunit [uncultured Eubacterium sp.]|uniref:exodeoxyribonuclease VII small subunit n=1 Tax=uncultured Eubacterium sp. TaxID=165185 RepID=UPI0026005BD6|nr:exodeoxyribonuclease VII small subunit [uncultured Eubacterium sp.]